MWLVFVWVVEAIKVELCQNFDTAAPPVPKFGTAAPKFGTAVPPVTKLRRRKHAVSVYMGPRSV